MNRRLQQFLELEQLTPSRLADILGIQRSGLSHILSGRNKPSFEFIQRFLVKFPSINPDWLITGKGKPYKDQDLMIPSTTDSSLFESKIIDNKDDRRFTKSNDLDENNLLEINVNKSVQDKNVKRITLFFSDGSFQEFYPSK